MSYPVATVDMVPLWIASDKGLFTKYGANVDLQFIAPAPASQALVAHSTDIYAGGPEGINIRAQGGDVKYFGALAPLISGLALYGRKGSSEKAASDADIAGKTIAATNREAQSDLFIRELLRQRGLDASKANFVYTQTLPASLAGLVAKQFDFAVLSLPIVFQAEADPTLVAVVPPNGAPEVKINGVSLMAYTTWIQSHEAEAKGILEAIRDASNFARANPDETQQIMSKYLKLDDKTILKDSYDFEKDVWGRPDLTANAEAFGVALRYASNASAKSETAADLIYHLYVLLAARGIDIAAVEDELARRAR